MARPAVLNRVHNEVTEKVEAELAVTKGVNLLQRVLIVLRFQGFLFECLSSVSRIFLLLAEHTHRIT
jgi:hypothetical protein